jgi:hypothetical protein
MFLWLSASWIFQLKNDIHFYSFTYKTERYEFKIFKHYSRLSAMERGNELDKEVSQRREL